MNEVPLSGRKSRAFSQRHHQPSRLDQIILHTSQKLILHQDWDILSCRKSSSTLGKGASTINNQPSGPTVRLGAFLLLVPRIGNLVRKMTGLPPDLLKVE